MGLLVRKYVVQDSEELIERTLEWGSHPPLDAGKWGKIHAIHPAWTGEWNGEVIASAGVHMFWPGVGEAWAELGYKALTHKKSVYVAIKKGLKIVWDSYGMHRIQASARVDSPTAQSLLEHLGFEFESCLRGFGADGSDSYMYVFGRS